MSSLLISLLLVQMIQLIMIPLISMHYLDKHILAKICMEDYVLVQLTWRVIAHGLESSVLLARKILTLVM